MKSKRLQQAVPAMPTQVAAPGLSHAALMPVRVPFLLSSNRTCCNEFSNIAQCLRDTQKVARARAAPGDGRGAECAQQPAPAGMPAISMLLAAAGPAKDFFRAAGEPMVFSRVPAGRQEVCPRTLTSAPCACT